MDVDRIPDRILWMIIYKYNFLVRSGERIIFTHFPDKNSTVSLYAHRKNL
jgi:hypothetical protein